MTIFVLPVLCAGLLLAAPAVAGMAAPAAPTVSAGRLENVPIAVPRGTPEAVVVYLSDRSGWKASDDAAVDALQAQGDVVLAVDLARYAEKLDADTGECLSVVGEITDLAKAAQRLLGIQAYLPPIVVGSGQGATFAYAALADSPANTLGGAVASGFTNRLDLKLPFCPGASSKKREDGGYSYGFDIDVPGPAHLFVPSETVDAVLNRAQARQNLTIDALDDGGEPVQIAGAVAQIAGAARPLGGLPAIDLPVQGPSKAVAVLVSGDGGWRDLDKTIGEWLAAQGVHVVGLDALHYFWTKRTPQELAADISGMLRRADPDQKLPVMLIGYSFGADTIPFAYPLLPKLLQERTKLIALMAPGQTTSFQVTISGWLGIDDVGYRIVPAIAALPAASVICVHGEDEVGSACPDPALKETTVIKTSGGRHFDGNYEALGQQFLDRMRN
ncbi:AcvB/VirJ family lysyl-phosphatidylglycerol hydrolase [Mesorhizobium sp. LHD-90]|uniref:virulence factor family protein n=1 Tax=Mesorhizobium sp. LHD-90 TaxID=3071414 RepID=UPI0027DF713A|nr:AcvB/VirJ family lysyl-phosphatidylglycerol hydrolase [Mesorhizobium sp. LHD-90]MDQ6435942.1 AcvB/VirJ family lysyl-phosphatidylglycerol hydrolase [Mesorhizobium sp. LHD-90]